MRRTHSTELSRKKSTAISAESGHLSGQWQGHFPVTSVAVMALLDRIAAGDENFSPGERILFVACEFWSALQGGELERCLDLKTEDPTRDARVALRIIGAVKLAHALEPGCLGPAGRWSTFRRRRHLEPLGESLQQIDETVDLLIARFAWRCMSDQHRGARALAGGMFEAGEATHFSA